MKNLLKYALIILISAGVFGCSSDNRKNEATEIPEVSVSAEQLAEDAAFQELFQEIDALNMQYFEATADIEPYAIGIPKWLRKVFNVVCADVVGAIACSWAGAAGATIGAIVNSVTVGACLDEEGKFMASETVWPVTFNSYLSSFSYDSNDAAGQIHNETIINTLNKYGKINLQTCQNTNYTLLLFNDMSKTAMHYLQITTPKLTMREHCKLLILQKTTIIQLL